MINNRHLSFISTLLLCGVATAAHIPKPNVIIIFTDDQGYQDLGCFGSPLISTPSIDSMAAEGIRLTDFYVSSSVCSASRASLLTGRKPIHHGVRGVYFPGESGMNNSEVTIASMLKTGGYRTAMFGKWHLGDQALADMPTSFGFDEYFGIPYSNDMRIWSGQTFATNCVFLEGYTLGQAINDQNNGGVKDKVPLVEGNEIVEYPAAQATLTQRYFDRAIATINSATTTNTNNPFFIYIAPAMPHIPLYASTNFAGTSARGTYGDVIEEIDYNVGRLLDHLKTNGLAHRTMVIFTSDNGPWLPYGTNAGSALPFSGGKFSVNEGGVREPCVMWWPGMWPSNQVSSQMISTVDILPTIAHYAETVLPTNYLAGFNVAHHLENTAVPTGKPYDAVIYNNIYALRKGDWKIMPTGPTTATGSPLLYNLANDITESSDQYAAEPAVVADMMNTFTNFLQTTNAPVDNTPPVAPAAGLATAGNRSIALDWPDNTEPDISHYLVYRSATGGGHYTPIALTQTSAYTDSNVILNVTNYYNVVAVDQRGNQSVAGPVMQAVPQNTNLALVEQKLIEFDFTVVSNNLPTVLNGIVSTSGVSVVRGLARNGLGLSTTALTNKEWNLTTTINNATLSQVLANNTNLYQDFALGATPGHSVKISQVRFDFYRNGAQAPTNYFLFVDEAGYATNTAIGTLQLTSANTTQTAFSVSNLWLSLDQLMEFRLYMSGNQAFNGNTHFNGASVYGVLTDFVPVTPTGLSASSTEGRKVRLNWNTNTDPDIAGYNIYRRLPAEMTYQLIASNQTTTTFTNAALPEGVTVYYKVSAVSAGGKEGKLTSAVGVTVAATVGANGIIDIVGSTSLNGGGEFADYSGLSGTDNKTWTNSIVNDGVVSLSASRDGLNGEVSTSGFNNGGSYRGAGTEINFTAANTTSSTAGNALTNRTFIAFKLDSRSFTPTNIILKTISLSLWRNGAAAAQNYQLAYDQGNNGYDTGDFLGTPTNITTTANFTLSQTLNTVATNVHEVRLYFWTASATTGNTHLFNVSVTYEAGGQTFMLWATNYGGTNVIGSATNDFDGDKLNNFAEYALNGNPTNAANQGQVSYNSDGSTFRYVHARVANDSSVLYRLIDATQLTGGAWNTNGYSLQTQGPITNGYQLVTNHYPITTDKSFIKLQVGQQ